MSGKRTKKKDKRMLCPCCGAVMVRRTAEETKMPGGRQQLLVCSRYPACRTVIRLRPGTDRPWGIPDIRELRRVRRRARRSLETVRCREGMTRAGAEQWLAGLLALPGTKARIGQLSSRQCRAVIERCERRLRSRKGGASGARQEGGAAENSQRTSAPSAEAYGTMEQRKKLPGSTE